MDHFVVVFNYFDADLISASCAYPLNGWLLGSYILVGTLRVAFMFYEAADRCVKIVAYVLMVLFLPATITWTVLGTVWYTLL